MSKKQTTIARSTTEAEGLAMDMGIKMLEYVTHVLQQMNIEYNTPEVHEDNKPLIQILNGLGYNRRTKYLLVKFNYMKELLEQNFYHLNYCQTEDMKADIMNKPVSKIRFEKLRAWTNMMT
jgi:hypothetical protein